MAEADDVPAGGDPGDDREARAQAAAIGGDASRVLTGGAEALRGAPDSRSLRLTLTEAEATSALNLGLMLPELMRAAEPATYGYASRGPARSSWRATSRRGR